MQDQAAIGAVGLLTGGTIVGLLARAFIKRCIRDLELSVKKICSLETELAKVSVKLDNFDKWHELILSLVRKVVALEARVFSKEALNGSRGRYDDEI